MAQYMHDRGTDRLLRDIADAKPERWNTGKNYGNGMVEIENDEKPAKLVGVVAPDFADLIAAAPDLLAACKLVIDRYGHLDELTNPCVQACRAAIARATGGAA